MSKPAKMYVLFVSLLLIFSLGTGIQSAKTDSGFQQPKHGLLRSIGQRFQIHAKTSFAAVGLAKPLAVGAGELQEVLPLQMEKPAAVKGIYLTSWMAGDSKFLQGLVGFVNQTEVNSIVVDVKDDSGMVSYPSKVPLVRQIGASRTKFNPQKLLGLLKQNNIYPIARIVVFKDPYLASHRPDLAVRNSQGGLWADFQGLRWVDPYNKAVWEYNVAVAKEAAALGFREVQFDYVRFTSDGLIKNCRYQAADNRSKSSVIRDFLKYAYQELNPMGIKVSADVFGLACSANDDLGIGQVLQKVAEGVDIICPMVYPSHYRKGEYNISDPDLKPLETVYQSLTDAQKKLAAVEGRRVILRPWLQDFSMRNRYGRDQLLAQINAVEKSGLQEWIFWNPTNRYDINKYRLKSEVIPEQTLPPLLESMKSNPEPFQTTPQPSPKEEP